MVGYAVAGCIAPYYLHQPSTKGVELVPLAPFLFRICGRVDLGGNGNMGRRNHAKIRHATTTLARVLGCWQAADPIILFETEKPGIGAAKHSSEIEQAEVP